MSIAINISLISVLALLVPLLGITVAIHFIGKESILNRLEIASRVLLAGAGLALGTLSILLFNQWDHGSGRAFLVILMLIIPYLFYIAVKGFNAPQERNTLA